MKAEERKALETNTLADSLGKAVEGLKHAPSRATLFYVGVLGGAVLAFLLFRYFYLSSEATSAGRWIQLDEVVFPEQLKNVLEDGKLEGTPQEQLARLKEARIALSLGLRDLGSSPTRATDSIREATTTYERLLDEKAISRVPLLEQEALWGAAKGSEALGDVDAARKYYTRLTEQHPNSTLGKDARTQLERLEAHEKEVADLARLLRPGK